MRFKVLKEPSSSRTGRFMMLMKSLRPGWRTRYTSAHTRPILGEPLVERMDVPEVALDGPG